MEQTQTTATPQQPADFPKKQRRVGTFTFALVLIAAGVLMILYLLIPGFDLIGIVKFSPVVLILLGVEVLFYAAKPNTTVKYDFLSMLACAFILCVVGGASTVSFLGLNFGPYYDYSTLQLKHQMTEQAYTALNADASLKDVVNSVTAYVQLNRAVGSTGGTITALEDGDSCTLMVELLSGKVADVNAFAAAAQKVIAAVDAAGVPVTEYGISSSDSDRSEGSIGQNFNLSGDAVWLSGMTADQLAERATARYFGEGSEFDNAADRDNFVKQQYREQLVQEYGEAHDGEYPGDEYIQQKLEERFAAPAVAEAPAPPEAPATPETAPVAPVAPATA